MIRFALPLRIFSAVIVTCGMMTLASQAQADNFNSDPNMQHVMYQNMATCGSINCYNNTQPNTQPTQRQEESFKGTPNSYFVWNWQDGTHWRGYSEASQVPAFDLLKQCEQETIKTYGENTCAMQKKNGKKKMVVALGYDNQAQRWWAVSNNGTKTNGDPKKILKECQDKGYVDCQIVWDGSH